VALLEDGRSEDDPSEQEPREPQGPGHVERLSADEREGGSPLLQPEEIRDAGLEADADEREGEPRGLQSARAT
jgi:hypothetical protein